MDSCSRADSVSRRLREAIRLGLLSDGEQLPSETVFAAALGVSTVTLREALAALRRDGLVATRRGRGGGTFVRAPAETAPGRLRERLERFSLQDLRDMGDYRMAIAAAAAYLAAQRASPENVYRLAEQASRLGGAASRSDRRRIDGRFHLELAAAAQSARLTKAEVALQAEVGDLLWLALDSEAHLRQTVHDHHRLTRAVERRNANTARRLAEKHVAAETTELLDARLALVST